MKNNVKSRKIVLLFSIIGLIVCGIFIFYIHTYIQLYTNQQYYQVLKTIVDYESFLREYNMNIKIHFQRTPIHNDIEFQKELCLYLEELTPNNNWELIQEDIGGGGIDENGNPYSIMYIDKLDFNEFVVSISGTSWVYDYKIWYSPLEFCWNITMPGY